MSWLARIIVSNLAKIKASADTGDITLIDDVLDVERAINALVSTGEITEDDKQFLLTFSESLFPKRNVRKALHRLRILTDKIGNFLGNRFLDEYLADEIVNENQLEQSDKQILVEFMRSRFSRKVPKRRFNGGNK